MRQEISVAIRSLNRHDQSVHGQSDLVYPTRLCDATNRTTRGVSPLRECANHRQSECGRRGLERYDGSRQFRDRLNRECVHLGRWADEKSRVPGNSITQSIYYAKNIVGAAANTNTVTVRFTVAAQYADIRILEYSGLDQVTPVDVTAAAIGTNATSSSGAATTTNSTRPDFRSQHGLHG